ncbi:MAG: hypothetical protein N3C12_11300 [Candidatus Binatia bacterium]|nr:hypothetical protein [Candidatus Binatia bacterium]
MKEGIVSDLFLISDLVVSGTDVKSVRLAAAKHGADAVLIMRAASQVDRYLNGFPVLYLTIVGLWLVPDTNVDALAMVQGAMWDVANGYLYATAEAFGEGRATGFGTIVEDKEALAEARKRALEEFGPEFIARLQSLYGS